MEMRKLILFLVVLIVLMGCFSGKDGPQSNNSKSDISISSPRQSDKLPPACVPHKQSTLLVKGSFTGKGPLTLEKGKGTLQISGSSFEVQWNLEPGPNEMVLKTPSDEKKLEVYRYTRELEEKLLLLKRGLRKTLKLPGLTYEFVENILIEETGKLEIEEGAVLRFHPEKGVDVYGALVVRGTKDKPVVFERANPEGPWRNITIGGLKASGELSYCSISGGGGATFMSLDKGRFSPEEGLVKNNWTIGGGLLILESPFKMEFCKVFENGARNGGGIYLYKTKASLLKNRIYSNEATHWGGGVFVMKGSPQLKENKFFHNMAKDQGGGVALVSTKSKVIKNLLSQNRAQANGGAIFVEKGVPHLIENEFLSNKADSYGGALALFSSAAQMEGNKLSGNQAASGGGTFVYEGNCAFQKNTFEKNYASRDGGGVFLSGSRSTFWQNRWESNQTQGSGGGVCSTKDFSNFAQNHFRGNRAEAFGGALFFRDLQGGSLVENELFENRGTKGCGAFGYTSRSPLQEGNLIKGNRPSSSFKVSEKGR